MKAVRHLDPITKVPSVAQTSTDPKMNGMLQITETLVSLQQVKPWGIFFPSGGVPGGGGGGETPTGGGGGETPTGGGGTLPGGGVTPLL